MLLTLLQRLLPGVSCLDIDVQVLNFGLKYFWPIFSTEQQRICMSGTLCDSVHMSWHLV